MSRSFNRVRGVVVERSLLDDLRRERRRARLEWYYACRPRIVAFANT